MTLTVLLTLDQTIREQTQIPSIQRSPSLAASQMVEKETGLRTCVIYGALPPEMRRLQARLFNERDSEYSVLVASDAVGMGLNLNIRRIIFHTLEKYDGETMYGSYGCRSHSI